MMESASPSPLPPRINEVGRQIVDAAVKVHSALGPGLLESAYQACLAQELGLRGLAVRSEVALPIIYEGLKLSAGFRIDLLVDECVVVEVKALDALHPIHTSQVLTYLKLADKRLGFLLNFNVVLMKHGIKRIVL